MASSSSTSNPLSGIQVQEKLTRLNYAVWAAQILAAIHGARLEGYITGKTEAPAAKVEKKAGETTTLVDNPAYEEWFARDQQVLGFLFSALSKEVMVQVAAAKTAAQAWKMIQDTLASHTRARVMNVRLALNTTKKESMTITEFYTKMTALGDELAAAGKPLDDEEMISYIVNGLDSDYNPLVSGIVARVDPITLSEFHS